MKFGKLILAVLAIGTVVLGSIACETEPMVPVPDISVLDNGLAGNKLVIKSQIPGEAFFLVREYSTSYDAQNWRITDSKTLLMSLRTEGAKGFTVFVEHVHADVALKSTSESLDGWSQDSMDDSVHGNQPGFWVTDTHPWEEVFAIEGFSQTLINGWSFYFGAYGSGSITQQRLTETNLVKYGGVYGNKVQIVYDLLLKPDSEPYFYTRSIQDEFLVPTSAKVIEEIKARPK